MTPTKRCIARHTGLWSAEPTWLHSTITAYRNGRLLAMEIDEAEERSRPVAEVTEDGIGIVKIDGPMMKGASKFGNTDTVEVRRAVREMRDAAQVRAIVVVGDSPGGMHDGTDELYRDISDAAAVKPVYGHIDDMGASALYYAFSGATSIYANPSAEVGCIGTMCVVEDTSGKAEAEGVKVHLVSSGPYKGAFAEGVPVTQEWLDELGESVKRASGMFFEAVRKGRKLGANQLKAVTDGRMFGASDALDLKLIDGVQRFDATLAMARREAKSRGRPSANARRVALAERSLT